MTTIRLAGATAALLALTTILPVDARRTETPLEHALALMTRTPLIDGHNDLPWAMRQNAGYDFDRVDLAKPQPALHTDIERLRAGHLGGQFWSVYVPTRLEGATAVTATLEQLAAVHELTRRYPDRFELASTADDVERIFRSGRIASMAGVEGGHSIDKSLPTLRMFYRLGARYMTLTHSRNVEWADSATDTPRVGGLSPFGEAVVREMNWLGMLVDLSHVSPATMKAALRVTEAPVIFSHSSARALCDVPRNVPDEVLELMPANGGVVMVTFVEGFTSRQVAEYERLLEGEQEGWKARGLDDGAMRREEERWRAAHPAPKATLSQVADHLDHIRKVAGIDHIGIGSDFDGIESTPVGLENVSKYPALVAELVKRGYSDDDLAKVLGNNVLRVMRAAERTAARLQRSRPPSAATFAQLDGKH